MGGGKGYLAPRQRTPEPMHPAAHFMYEAAHAQLAWGAPSPAPQGWSAFAANPIMRPLLDPGHKIAHWSEFERGGHFAAMEAPICWLAISARSSAPCAILVAAAPPYIGATTYTTQRS